MADSGLLIGVLTATTALAASYVTARATTGAAVAQARVTADATALREERDRRRTTYRDLMSRVHTFMEILWRLGEADAATDPQARDRAVERLHEQAGPAMAGITAATREVLLDGPPEVAEAAERVRDLALRLQRRLLTLGGDAPATARAGYDAAYEEFRTEYLAFIASARQALAV